jgi:hypothetical protein
MAEVTPQPDGSTQVTVSQGDAAALNALAAQHLGPLKRAAAWFEVDIAPELGAAVTFLESLASNPAQGTTLSVSAAEAQYLRGLLTAHVPDFQAVLAVVESPAVRSLLSLAKALL